MEVSSKKLEETLYLVIMYPCVVESKAQGFLLPCIQRSCWWQVRLVAMHPEKLPVAASVGKLFIME